MGERRRSSAKPPVLMEKWYQGTQNTQQEEYSFHFRAEKSVGVSL